MGFILSKFGRRPATKTHELTISTGDKKGASVHNANVYMTLIDKPGNTSEEQHLTDWRHNDFGKGKEENIKLDLPGLLKITDICIRRDDNGKDDEWYIEKIVINHLDSHGKVMETSIFPLNRWLHAGDKLSFSEFDSCLPQFDKYAEQRKKELVRMREEYVLDEKIPGGPLQVENLPNDEKFTTRYFLEIAGDLVVGGIKAGLANVFTDEFDSLVDIESLYEGKFKTPEGVNRWRSDEEFGNQKLAGCNPAIIERCRSPPAHMEELQTHPELLEPHLEGLTLEQAIEARKLYIIDLRYLADIECPNGKTLPGPTCLLFVRHSGDLVPVAIQLMPEAAKDNPIFTPSDQEYTWLAAKMWFNLADCSHHQSASHLGLTHLLMESVAVVTNRQLSQSHPIYRLLAPHFLFIMNINDLAVKGLVSVGGWVDTVMHIGRTGMFNIIREKWAIWKISTDGHFIANLKHRDVEDIPNYFYKEDGLLLWNAVVTYVTTLVTNVYDTDEKYDGDFELHAWLKELNDAASIHMPENMNKEVLVDVVAAFIFNSSVQHAAVNFGQYDEYAFPPNYPADLHGKRPTTRDPLTEDLIVKALPYKKQTLDMIHIMKVLSDRGTQALGNFEIRYGYDPVASSALESLQRELETIQTTIEERNKTRKRHYDILEPKDVPNAISI